MKHLEKDRVSVWMNSRERCCNDGSWRVKAIKSTVITSGNSSRQSPAKTHKVRKNNNDDANDSIADNN